MGGCDMRIRTIKPEFWTNEDIAAMDDFTKLLAIGLLNYADDEGYFNANPALIRAAIFPLRDESGSITVAVQTLAKARYLTLFKGADGRSYGLIANFKKHQVINKSKGSKIKEFCGTPEQYCSYTVAVRDEYRSEQGTGNREQGVKEEERAAELLKSDEPEKPELGWSATAGWFGVTDEVRGRWGLAYPACNLDRQLAQMDTWLRANPKEAKKTNWHRFAANWLKREQDKGGDVRADRRNSAPAATAELPIRVGFTNR